jgi:hypothetical protein
MPTGRGNIAQAPLFADPAAKDFHLKSEYGRWVPAKSEWVKDDVTSSCIDAGSPADPYEAEPPPNGGRVNIGACGNTPEASRSEAGTTPGEPATTPPDDSMARVQQALCGTAPEGDALEGRGPQRTAGLLWLPDSPQSPGVNAALKSFRFESNAATAEAEGELEVNLGWTGVALEVREDGEPIERLDRQGPVIRIRGIRPNSTYEIRKASAKDLRLPE